MIASIKNILGKLPEKTWSILAVFLGISLVSTPIAIAYLIVNSGSIEYKNADTEINLKGKRLAKDNSDLIFKLTEKLNKLEKANQELSESVKRKKLDKQLKPQIEKIDRAILESEIVAEDLKTNQEELPHFVEDNPIEK